MTEITQDVSRFDRIIDRYERSEESLLAILQEFQREFHYVSRRKAYAA